MRGAIPEGVAPITVIHGNRPVIPLHGILAKGQMPPTNAMQRNFLQRKEERHSMKYRILNFNLNPVTGWHKSFANAVRKCLATMNQQSVWFIEDFDSEVIAIVHCQNVWIPTDKDKLDGDKIG